MLIPERTGGSRRQPAANGRGLASGLATGLALGLALDLAAVLPLATGASAAGAKKTTVAASHASTKAAPSHPAIFDRVEEYRLDNGMLFLLLPRHEIPTISGRICFRVGNVDCPAGQTGLAHMFEHMAFKGTDKIGTRDYAAEMVVEDSVSHAGNVLAVEMAKGARADTALVSRLRAELNRLLDREDAVSQPNEFPQLYDHYTFDFNAYTSPDFTVYTTELPANNLEVWMLMESERIHHPSMREFFREREVVSEERRQYDEDNPENMAWELLYSLAFTAHPYHIPTIGYRSDIVTLTADEAAAFRRIYYVPGNAVGVLVGDFDPAAARKMLQDYFGTIPAGPMPPEIPTQEPKQKGMRRGTFIQGTDRELMVCFHAPDPRDTLAVTAQVLSDVLAHDETSRLIRRLVNQEKVARSVTVSPDGGYSRYPGVFEIQVLPMPEITNEQVESILWDELGKVVSNPITPEKLKEIQASYRKRSFRGFQRNSDLANALMHDQETYGDWRRCYSELELLDAVTPERVTALAAALFQKEQATVVDLEPEPAPPAGANGQQGGK